DPDNPSGGAMHVVKQVLAKKGGSWAMLGSIIGGFFCITLIISTITGGNMFQAWNVAGLTEGYFGVPKVATGIILAMLVGLVIIGGIKRIGTVASKLVPLMCLLYLMAGFAVLVVNADQIPGLLKLVFDSAFGTAEAEGAFIGGTLGYAFVVGMKRALFSNEAGQGSAPIAHAAAKTAEPAREGVVGGLGPFIDTICICTLTAMVILSTGTWNRDSIGPLATEISLAAAGEGDEYIVTTAATVSHLPEQRLDQWSHGDKLFVLAEAQGMTHRSTGSNRFKITGVIDEVPDPEHPDAAVTLVISWGDVELKSSDWDGIPGDIQILEVEGGGAGIYREYEGAQLTAFAFDRVFEGLGKWLVTLAAWLFAISTMISWSYYGEKGVAFLVGVRGILPYKIAFLLLAIVGAAMIENTDQMMLLADLGTGSMLVVNIPILLALGYIAV
ncbi:MAG TPA: amino acid carrier protein, partial [Planctomycetes bacterium]|nr:amino acid carrier protein [Planctomycetota bacterium]